MPTKGKVLLFALLALVVGVAISKNSAGFFSNKEDVYGGTSYVPVNPKDYAISILSSDIASPTRVKITPDGKYLLVSDITGEVFAFTRTWFGWSPKPQKVLTIETRFPGFPPDEAGLVGIIFSTTYGQTGKAFFLYTYKDQGGKILNRIASVELKEKSGLLTSSPPQVIYEANIPGSGSHQITDGISINVAGKPHLLFLIGEGFDAKRAQDPAKEGGKLVLIQEDGSDPLGPRPYSQNPKVQAIGIRNGFVLAQNTFDPAKRILLTDTGPDHFDRIIYTMPVSADGKSLKKLNFGWDGNEQKLKNPIPDPNFASTRDMVIYRLTDTRTFSGLSIHPGGGPIPKSDSNSQSVLVTLFGKTGSKENEPGKEILLGKLTSLTGQPEIAFETIIKRSPRANGMLGNPLGLEVDPATGDFFFADILEGRVYWVKPKGGDTNAK